MAENANTFPYILVRVKWKISIINGLIYRVLHSKALGHPSEVDLTFTNVNLSKHVINLIYRDTMAIKIPLQSYNHKKTIKTYNTKNVINFH
jgi:hypothetical protein